MEKPKAPAKVPPKPENKAGHVRHDKSGRAIWEWAVETGRHALDSTSRLLKKLEHPGLSIEETARIAKLKAASPTRDPAPPAPKTPAPRTKDALSLAGSGGFNPYNSRGAPPKRPSPPARSVPARQPIRTNSPRPAESPGFLARLFGAKR